MAKQKSYIKIQGKLGGLSFYELNGNSLIRETKGVNKDRILNDPAYERTRENMTTFGGSATVGKALRMGLVSIVKYYSGKNASARITKIMHDINKKSGGTRGERPFLFVPNKNNLIGFEFNLETPFDSLFLAPYALTANQEKNQVQLQIPSFSATNYIVAPQGATHFKLVLAITVLSDYIYNNQIKKYEPQNPNLDKLNNVIYSDILPVNQNTPAAIQLNSNLPNNPQLDATSALIACIGIEFFQQSDGVMYSLKTNRALKIRDIF